MRAVIIGCGAISRTHVDAIKKLNEEIIGLCDKDINRAEKLREEKGLSCPVFDDYESMFDTLKPDVVHVCTSHFLHAPMSIAALKRDINVLSEKPVCVTSEQYDELVAAIKASKANYGVCFQNRYNATTKALLDVVNREKVIGLFAAVPWYRSENYYLSTDWRGRKASEGGGVMMNQAIHTLDLTLLLLGNPTAVTGTIANHHLIDVINEEDMAEMLIKFESGATATFYATTANAFDAPVTIILKTEKGVYTQIGNLLYGPDNALVATNAITGVQAKDYWGTGHLLLISDFYEHIRQGKPFPIDAEEAYKSVRLIAALYRSNGQKIEL